MSQLSKILGGKRVDFSRARGINRWANVAVHAFQTPAQGWYISAHRALLGHSPKSPLRDFIMARRKKHVKSLQRWKLFQSSRENIQKRNYIGEQSDSHHGEKVEKADVSAEMFAILKEQHFKKIKVPFQNALEKETRSQASCQRWREERQIRIFSSSFYKVANRRITTPSANLMKLLLYRKNINTEATRYGIENEERSVQPYKKINSYVKGIRSLDFVGYGRARACLLD